MKKIDWSAVDWRKPVRQIAREEGCSRQAVYLAQAKRWSYLESDHKPKRGRPRKNASGTKARAAK